MKCLLEVLQVRLQILLNRFTKAPRAQQMGLWGGMASAVVIALVVGWASYEVLAALFASADELNVPELPYRIPSVLLLWTFWMLFFSGVSVAIQHLYGHREVALLLSAPLPASLVFIVKFVDIAAVNAGLFALLGGPVFLAYGLAMGYLNSEYLVRGGLCLAAFSAIPSALGATLSLFILRALPANRLREIIGAAGITLVALSYLALNFFVLRLHEAQGLLRSADALANTVRSPTTLYGPWAWAGEVLSRPTGYPEAYGSLFLVILAAAAAVTVGAAVAERMHWLGWTTAQEAPPVVRRARGHGVRVEAELEWLPGPIRAFLMKELRTLGRDLRQLSMLLLPMAIIFVFLANVHIAPNTQYVPPGLLSLVLLPLIGTIAIRVSASAFVGESRALWVAFVAPNSLKDMLLGKLLYTVVLTAPLALVALVGYGLMHVPSPDEWAITVGLAMLTNFALCGLSVGTSGYRMDVSGDTAVVSVSNAARIITLLLQTAYGGAVAAFLVWARFLSTVSDYPPVILQLTAIAGVMGVTGVAALGPLVLAANRLDRMEI